MRDIIKLGFRLLVITLVAGIALGGTYVFTKPNIDKQEQLKAAKATQEVLPQADTFAKMPLDSDSGKIISLTQGTKSGTIVGYVFEVTTKGYADPFIITVGIDSTGKITGLKVGVNKETPGLGAEAAGPKFQGQFEGKSAQSDLSVVKNAPAGQQIEALTGATITSRGIADAVNSVLAYYRAHFAKGGQ